MLYRREMLKSNRMVSSAGGGPGAVAGRNGFETAADGDSLDAGRSKFDAKAYVFSLPLSPCIISVGRA